MYDAIKSQVFYIIKNISFLAYKILFSIFEIATNKKVISINNKNVYTYIIYIHVWYNKLSIRNFIFQCSKHRSSFLKNTNNIKLMWIYRNYDGHFPRVIIFIYKFYLNIWNKIYAKR